MNKIEPGTYYLAHVVSALLPGAQDNRRSLISEEQAVGVGSAFLVVCIIAAIVLAIIFHRCYQKRLQDRLNQLLQHNHISPFVRRLLNVWRPALLTDAQTEYMLSLCQKIELDITPLFAVNALSNQGFCAKVVEVVMQHMMSQKRRYRIRMVACKWYSVPQRMEFYRVVFALLKMQEVNFANGYWFSGRDKCSIWVRSADPTDEARHCARMEVALANGDNNASTKSIANERPPSARIKVLYTAVWNQLRLDHPIVARIIAMASLLPNDQGLSKAMLEKYLAGEAIRQPLQRYARSVEVCDFAIGSVLMILIHFGLVPMNSVRMDGLFLYRPFLTEVVAPDVQANHSEYRYFIDELHNNFNQTIREVAGLSIPHSPQDHLNSTTVMVDEDAKTVAQSGGASPNL